MALALSLFILYALSSSALADSPDIASPKHRLLLLKAGAIDPSQTNPLSVENSFAALSSPTKQHYIVQFSDSVSDETKQTVRDLIDNDLNWYIPYNAFVVYTTAEAILTIQQMDEITWTGIWDSKYKFQPVTSKSKRFLVFEDAPLSQAFELVITLPETPQTSELLQELRQRWTAEAAASLNCSFRIEAIPPNRLLVSSISFSNKDISRVKDFNTISAWFADKPEVYHVDRRDTFSLANYWAKSLVQNDNPEVQSESSLFFTQNGIYGQDQIIGVSDSGLSTASCFFQDPNHFVNFTFAPRNADPSTLLSPGSHRKIIQYVVPEDTGDEVDEDGHGTHVSGTVAGKVLSDPNGFSKYNGIASESRIAFFDIQKGKAVSLPFPLDTAYLPFSYGMGARVNTNSWGSTASEDLKQYTLSSHDVDRFVWNHPDMLLLFAAGNLGSSGITPPATAKNVIAVGASVSSRNMFRDVFCYSNLSDSNACSLSNYLGDDMQNDLADFSSQGPTSDDRIKPDLVAPGRYLVSAGRGCQGRTDTDLEVEQGTSMATPVVASHMLLVREYLMRGFLKNGIANRYESIAPSAALLKAIAVSGAFPIHRHEMVSKDGILSTAAVSDPPDNLQGFGRLKLNRVLNFMNNEAKHKTFIPRRADRSDPILNLTTVHLYTFCVAYKYSLYPPRFTIVWTDYPAQIAASSSLVQDIDLTVNTSSDPSLYYGNGGAAADHVNTVERVSLPGSINPGVEITVRVKASSLPMANQQPYALVATGRIVQTPCSVEFPDGVIPPDRWIDESLSVAAPLSIWAALIQLNIGDRRVQFVLGSVAVAVIAIVCCCYCAFHFDENCFHHKTKPGENLSFEFNPRLGDQASNAGGSKAISTHSEPSAGRTLYSFPSSRHQRTVSEGFASSTMKSDAIAVGPMTLKHPSLPPVRSTHQDSNLQNAWNQGTQ